jgi:hypothetical protein
VKENEKGCGALLGLEVSAKARTYFGESSISEKIITLTILI